MATPFTIKQGDLGRPLRATLSTDLTGTDVQFRMADASGAMVIDAPATIVTPSVVVDGVTSGVVEYAWQPGDTDFAGFYQAEFLVTYSGGRSETFPAEGYIDVFIGDGIPLEEDSDTFRIDTSGSELLCSDQMIRDLLTGVTEFVGSIYDAPNKLAELKVQARDYIQFQTGRWIGYRDYVGELHDGDDSKYLVPNNTPIISVASIVAAGVTLVAGTDYWVYGDRIDLLATFPRGHQNVRLSYRAGLGRSVDFMTAMVIARLCALFVVSDVAFGPSQASSIQVGPIALRESFSQAGKYAETRLGWQRFIDDYLAALRGVRISVVDGATRTPRLFVPRLDRFV